MELNEYQIKAMKTCTSSSNNFSYMLLNLVGEIGEFSSKIAKHIRKEKVFINQNKLITEKDYQKIDTAEIDDLKKEVGDVMWQIAGLCTVMNWDLEDICQINLNKLQARQKVGTIIGNGDSILRNID